MATLVTQSERGLLNAARPERWVVQQGLQGNTADAVFEGFSAASVPCAWLRPLHQGFGLVWRRGVVGVEEEIYTASNSTADVWERSTLKVMVDDGEPELRRRIFGPEAGEEFPILEKIR